MSCIMIVPVWADHIIGGEMYYSCLGNNEYLVTLKMYRDCYSSGALFDDPGYVALYTLDGELAMSMDIFLSDQEPIDASLQSPCIAFPPDLCVEVGMYYFTITIPDPGEAYELVYQRCCRNESVQNLLDPGAQGLTIVANFAPDSQVECNSSPYFNELPPVVLCNEVDFNFDHSATDPDGDSLAYSLCSPYIGATEDAPMPMPASPPPYDQVVWGAAYSATDPIPGDPQFSIDPVTGWLTGHPTQLGQYVVGVCVEEWRDGEMISNSVRDFQFNVAACENVYYAVIADPEEDDFCQGLSFDFINESATDNDFIWDFGDPTTEDDISTAYSPSYTYPDTGTYNVTLVTNPGFFCSDTAFLTLPVYFSTEVNIETLNSYCENDMLYYQLEATGDVEGADLVWEFGDESSSSSSSGAVIDWVTFDNVGENQVSVQLLNNICTGVDTVVIEVPEPIAVSIDPQEEYCFGFTAGFSQTSQNATSFEWDFGDTSTDEDVSIQSSANYTFPGPGFYTVSLTASAPGVCPVSTTEVYDIQPLLAVSFPEQDVQCLEGNSFNFTAEGSYAATTSFNWQFENALTSFSSEVNPSHISYASDGTFNVSVTVADYGCVREYSDVVYVQKNPVADFYANNLVGCSPHQVSFVNESFSQSGSVVYDWDFGDGHHSTSKNPQHSFQTEGIYTIALTVKNLTGCIDSDTKTEVAYVQALPVPEAGFKIDPNPVSLVDPQLHIVDESEGAISCSYQFLRDEVENQFDFMHELKVLEPQYVTQSVVNEYGCRATATGYLRINDHLLYVPNAFTPDEDGINDIFKPVTVGVVALEMQIYDRWGKLVWQTDELGEGWNGQGLNEDFYDQADVFQYRIRLTDNNKMNYDYAGYVTLIR